MKTIIRLLVLILLLAGWGLAAASLHVIRTPTTITVVPKDRLGFSDTYVDTRTWTLDDVTRHAGVVRRLVQLGKSELLSNVADPKSSQPLEAQLHQALDRAQPPANTTQPTARTAMTVAKAISQLDIVWGDSR